MSSLYRAAGNTKRNPDKLRWYPDKCARHSSLSEKTKFLSHPKSIRAYLYTTNQLERLMKEMK